MKSAKRMFCSILTIVLLITALTPVMAGNNIKVRLGGELIKFDVQPQIINNRTMVPLRAIFEALGTTVEWNGEKQTVTSTKGDTTISLTINNPAMYVNGTTVTLDSPACLVGGRTLVPVRAISEAFKLKVDWDDKAKTVRIRKSVSLLTSSYFGYDGSWEKYTYDENGNEVYYENSYGRWTKNTYDENGNMVFREDSDGSWSKYTVMEI